MKIYKKHGFPVVTAGNVFEILSEIGFKKWLKMKPAVRLDEFLKEKLTKEQSNNVRRYVPAIEVSFFKNPDGENFEGFRWAAKDWASVFTLLDGYVVLVAEFRHGAEIISVGLPSGSFHTSDASANDPMKQCAKREFKEETGVDLEKLISLTDNPEGIAVNSRANAQYYFPFLGISKNPVVKSEQKLDKTEFIEVVLMKIDEWLKFIEYGKAEMNNGNTTLLALMKLKKMNLL